ncbi:hypothetical protein [Kitasatospora sp. NPDC097691]|uniref:hypothetical protein n=1 Tax=Kitasatospora sp. NPDC097691 TaxID=3157231 RepID=UPI00331BF3F5
MAPTYWGVVKATDVGKLRATVQALAAFEAKFKQRIVGWQTMQRNLANCSWHGTAQAATDTALQDRTNQLFLVDQMVEDLRRVLTDAIDELLLLQLRQKALIGQATGNCLEVVDSDTGTVVRVLPPDQHSRNDPEWRKEVEVARDRLVTDITAFCEDAASVDRRLSAALGQFDTTAKSEGDYFPDDVAKSTKDARDLDRDVDQSMGYGEGNPEANRAWWQGLDEATRRQFLQDHPGRIGALDGLPAETRDQANRAWLPQLRAQLAQDISGPTPPQNATQANLAGLDALQKQIDTPSVPPQLLLSVDNPLTVNHAPGAVIAYGNPDTATNIAAYVPANPAVGTLPADAAAARGLAVAAGKADPTKPTASIVFTSLGLPGDTAPSAFLGSPRDSGTYGTYNALRASHRNGNANLSEVAASADGSGYIVAGTPLDNTTKVDWSSAPGSIAVGTPGRLDDPHFRQAAANAIVGRR